MKTAIVNHSVEDLQKENEALRLKVEELEALLPKQLQAKDGYAIVFIKSDAVTATKKKDGKYVKVRVTGKNDDGSEFHMEHDVKCDCQVEVPQPIAEALKGVIEAQSK